MFERKLLRADEALIRVPKKTEEEAETKEKTETGKLKIEKDGGKALPCKQIMEEPRVKDSFRFVGRRRSRSAA